VAEGSLWSLAFQSPGSTTYGNKVACLVQWGRAPPFTQIFLSIPDSGDRKDLLSESVISNVCYARKDAKATNAGSLGTQAG